MHHETIQRIHEHQQQLVVPTSPQSGISPISSNFFYSRLSQDSRSNSPDLQKDEHILTSIPNTAEEAIQDRHSSSQNEAHNITATISIAHSSPSSSSSSSPPIILHSRQFQNVESHENVENHYRFSPAGHPSPVNSLEDDVIVDSDDEDSGKADSDCSGEASSNSKKKRRVLFTKYQTKELQKRFGTNWYISSHERDALARHLNMDPDQVKIWFQNHRYKVKKMYKEAREKGGGPSCFYPSRPYPNMQRDLRKPPNMRDFIFHNDPYFAELAKDPLYLENTRPLNSEYFPNSIYNGSLQGLQGVGFSTTPFSEFLNPRTPYPSRSVYPGHFNPFDGPANNPLSNYMLSAGHLHAYPRMMRLGVTL